MIRRHDPPTLHPPAGRYSHGVEVPPDARLLYVSGQVGMAPDGSVPNTDAAQCEQAWRNLLGVLAAAGMGPGDIVKLNAYLARADAIPAFRAARDRALGTAPPPASTLVVVAGLADPRWIVEIECVAAKT